MAMEFSGERFVPSLRGQIYYEHIHRYAIAARFCRGKRVLDIASGEGYGSALLARVAAHVTGIDIDQTSVQHAEQAYTATNLAFICGSCMDIPLADHSVDVIASFETIEHIDNPERMLDELRRVVVPGGTIVISSPNKRVYSDLPGYSNPFHIRELYFSELRDMLCSRFENVKIFGQRVSAASLVHPLVDTIESTSAHSFYGADTGVGDGLPAIADPVYFIAACSDAPLAEELSSVFVDKNSDPLADASAELASLHERCKNVYNQYESAVEEGNGERKEAISGMAHLSRELERSRNENSLLGSALENTEESLLSVRQTLDDAHRLAAAQRAHLADYQGALEAAQADRGSLRMRLVELVLERDAAIGDRDRKVQLEYLLAERTRQLAQALALSDARDQYLGGGNPFRTLREIWPGKAKRIWRRLLNMRVSNAMKQ